MKKQFFFFALLLAGMFSFQTVNAQFALPTKMRATFTGTTDTGKTIKIHFNGAIGFTHQVGVEVASLEVAGVKQLGLQVMAGSEISRNPYTAKFQQSQNGVTGGPIITLTELAAPYSWLWVRHKVDGTKMDEATLKTTFNP